VTLGRQNKKPPSLVIETGLQDVTWLTQGSNSGILESRAVQRRTTWVDEYVQEKPYAMELLNELYSGDEGFLSV
jgi:hypothetical protein